MLYEKKSNERKSEHKGAQGQNLYTLQAFDNELVKTKSKNGVIFFPRSIKHENSMIKQKSWNTIDDKRSYINKHISVTWLFNHSKWINYSKNNQCFRTWNLR